MRNKLLLILFSALACFMLQGNTATAARSPLVDFTYAGICVNSETIFTVDAGVTNVNDVVIWDWSFGDGDFSNIKNPVHTYAGAGDYPVTLTITDKFGAVGTVTHLVSIKKLPVANFEFSTPDCNNEAVFFTDHSTAVNGNIEKRTWDFGDGSPVITVLPPGDPNPSHVFPNTNTFNVTLRVMNSDLCENQVVLPVTISARPKAKFFFSGECQDQVVNFSDASVTNGGGSIISHTWNFRDPISGIEQTSNAQNPLHVFANPGSYLVKLTITNYNNCIDTISKPVLIKASPAVDFVLPAACLNSPAGFTPDLAVTNIATISSWFWDFGDGNTSPAQNASNTYLAPGTYTVKLTVTDLTGCKKTVSHNLVIDPLPTAHFSAPMSVCAGASADFQNLSATAAGYIAQWQWDFGDGNSQTINHPDNPDVSHIYTLPNTYIAILKVTASNGCISSKTQKIVVRPNPVANYDFTPACVGTPVSFSDLSQTNGAGSVNSFSWEFDDAGSGILNYSDIQNPDHEFVTTGNHTVRMIITASNSCSDTVTKILAVKPAPVVNFTASNTCQGNAVTFSPDASVMNIAAVGSWLWEFGSGNTSVLSNPAYVFPTAGNQQVKLTITDNSGCSNSITKPVTIIAKPIVKFTFQQPVCSQSAVLFNNISDATPGTVLTSTWDFGDGTSQNVAGLNAVSHKYASPGLYYVQLKVTTSDGCQNSVTEPVNIVPEPTAGFSIQSVCINTPVQFTDQSVAGAGTIASWQWNFGDMASGSNVSTLRNPSHTFSAAGTYQVKLVVSNTSGCTDTIQKTVSVRSLPVPDFTFTVGCVNSATQFSSAFSANNSSIISRLWSFGDGGNSNVADPAHVYTAAGTFSVTLTITDTAGCSNSVTKSVTILASPVSSFTVSSQNCTSNPIQFTNTSVATNGTITSFHWEFGDGSDAFILSAASADVTHTYKSDGPYKVRLTVHSSLGCEAISERTVVISAGPQAQFSFDNTCEGAAVAFTDQSDQKAGASVVKWNWNFGDPLSLSGNYSDQQNPEHVFSAAGIFAVNLDIENANGCKATVSKTVMVKAKPAVDFTWVAACFGSATSFSIDPKITAIADIASFEWDFGDGTPHNITQKNPVHTYQVLSNYTVTLTITNISGCKNVVTHQVSILPKPTAMFSTLSSCAGTITQFADQSLPAGSSPVKAWKWDFGVPALNADTSAQQHPQWLYASKGIYNVRLTAIAQNGCQDEVIRTVQVYGPPTADFSYSASACENGNVEFQNASFSTQSNIVSSSWLFEPNSTSNLFNPSYVFYTTDSCYNVRLIVKDFRGCIDTVVKPVCVPADYDFTFSTTSNCINDTTYFVTQLLSPKSGSLVKFNWDFGDAASGAKNTSTLKMPSHYYAKTGTYTVSLEATDENNCVKTIYKNITINPLPVPVFTYTTGICDSTIYFNESSTGNGSSISKWIWSFGDGVTTTVTAPSTPDVSHLYPAPGIYDVSLTVVNQNGCSKTFTNPGIVLNPCLNASFELRNTKVCQNNNISFLNTSFSSLPSNIWYWDFGDGSRSTFDININLVNHKFKAPGAYKVQLVVSAFVSGRRVTDTTYMIVNVSPSPKPDFTTGMVCNKQLATFTNTTSGSGAKIVGYNWSFGESKSAPNDTTSVKDPTHMYLAPGSYEVMLTAKNDIGCSDSIRKIIVINGLPAANFKTTLSCAGQATVFTDLSTKAGAPITTWNWTFYDNMGIVGGKDLQNPDYVFKKPGEYMVHLRVVDAYGCRDSISKYISTWDVPVSNFSMKENYDDEQGQLQFTNGSRDATRYHWTFGNGDDSYAEQPVYAYKDEGSYKISLVAYNSNGCSDTMSTNYNFMIKGLFIPNAFSPQNPIEAVRLLKPVGIHLQEYRFEVYDRWGNLLWWTDKLDSNGCPTEGWDGMYKDKMMPSGVYPWRATGVFMDGSIWQAENIGNSDHLPKYRVGTSTMMK